MPSPKAILIPLAAAFAITACDSSTTESALDSPPAAEPAPASEPAPTPATKAKSPIFNGKNLDGWSAVLVDKSLSKEDVWRVEDGILICKGKPLGYLQTDASYQDFKLTLEWRWAPGTEPTNSGVLLRIAEEPETFLPKSVEAQLQHQRAGDLYGFFGASLEGDPERFKIIESEKIGTMRCLPHIKGMENPAGEWNRYEITVMDDTVKLMINGELVNQGHGIDILAGPIGLQTEGSEIHFRNIHLTEL